MFWIIFLGFLALSIIMSYTLKSKFKKYSLIGLRSNMTGLQVAEQMLSDHGIYDVQVTCVAGHLTDHYDPSNKTVNLSEQVYFGNSAASAAVAAHECGHAVQHATAYNMLQLRTALVPIQNISAGIMNFIFIASFIGSSFFYRLFPMEMVMLVIIAAYSIFTLFSLITLPVEFDASKRALQWIDERGIVTSQEHYMAKDALNWAAMTYVVAALGSLSMLLYYVLSYFGISRD